MDAQRPLLHAFQKPTMENVRILEEYVNKDAVAICARGQDKLIITGIFTMIAELPDIRYASRTDAIKPNFTRCRWEFVYILKRMSFCSLHFSGIEMKS